MEMGFTTTTDQEVSLLDQTSKMNENGSRLEVLMH